MNHTIATWGLGAILAGCAAAPARPPEPVAPACPTEAAGTPAMLTIRPGAETGPRIDEPEVCDRETYIAVHGSGTRPIRMGRAALEACPEQPTSPEDCVFADRLGRAVAARLPGISVGIGLGACGRTGSSEADFRFSIKIHDWQHADAAIAAVAAELEAQQVGGVMGVSVGPVTCGIQLEGAGS